MYMDDAVKATIDLMQAPPENVKIRSSYNIAAMSFSPAQISSFIQDHLPSFAIKYSPDFRQDIADSWPDSIDDSEARKDWGWQPQYDLERMTSVILKGLRNHLQKQF